MDYGGTGVFGRLRKCFVATVFCGGYLKQLQEAQLIAVIAVLARYVDFSG